ncbi:MAG TPA: M1 family metallopeptidase [Pyrinomonadaceae bacterium]|nr:M1 family metallopeptidase [Pyrinomonadaceae bacterium]
MIKSRHHALFVVLLLITTWTSSYATRRERLIESWQPLHYNVSLVLDDQLSEIVRATAEITILTLKDNVSLIDLDFGELAIDSIKVNNEAAQFERQPGLLNIKLSKAVPRNTRLVVMVAYHGRPKDGLIMSKDKAGKPSAVGDNWPDRLHHWIPCLDHPSAKATVSFTVTAPARALVVANGRLDRVDTLSGGVKTWSYTEGVPIPPYCMIIAAGEFAQLAPPERDVTPLSYYVPVPDKDAAMLGFSTASPSLKFFSQTVAPYPYEKLALIVGATRFGGMENSSAIVFSSNLFTSRPRSEPISKVFNIRAGTVSLVAHEIAHQWFGDSVTESTWADLWLSEGFATYFAGLMLQRYEGEEVFQEYMKRTAETYFSYEQRTSSPIHDTETENLFSLLNANNYQKGAWVLHMLRSSLGDDAFFRGIRAYYSTHKNATASTEDLRAALEKASKQNLKEFFARWIYGAGHPRYELTWSWKQRKSRDGVLVITLNQTQKEEAFLMAVPLEISTSKGVVRKSIKPSGKETTLRLPLANRPTAVRLDPGDTILKETL